MVYRLSALAAMAGVALSGARLRLLLQPSDVGLPWQAVIVAAVILGAVLTWAATGYRLRALTVLGINLVAFGMAAIRIMAPSTTIWGLLPSSETASVAAEELAFAMELIRFGSAPVVPVKGLVVIIAFAYWVFGAATVWGFSIKRPTIPILLPLALYLQFATIDRDLDDVWWPLAFVAIVSFALAAVRIDERRYGTGRLRVGTNPSVTRTRLFNPLAFGLVIGISAVALASVVHAALPSGGILDWRANAGIGTGISRGISYNLFVSTVQTDLLTLSDEPVFIAKVNEGVDGSELFWTLITLEAYDGTNWYPAEIPTQRPTPDGQWVRADHAYQGNTQVVDQVVRIESLRQNYLPTVTTASDLVSEDQLLTQTFRVRDDAALRFDALTSPGLQYQIRSTVPADTFASLASQNGELSPMFSLASDEGQFVGQADTSSPSRLRPENIDTFLEYPDDMDVRITQKAQEIVQNGTTDFERSLLLEQFYRDSGEFIYSVEIDAGHSATDLADWLFEPESPNFRTGYCEQFSTGMAVMARTIGIPSRVVLGFTPGDVDSEGLITVRARNAHAWVELWIDNHGWVRFDPTPRSDGVNPSTGSELRFAPNEFARPLDPLHPVIDPSIDSALGPGGVALFGPNRVPLQEFLAGLDDPLPSTSSSPASSPIDLPGWLGGLSILMVAVAIVPVIKSLRRRRRLARLESGSVDAAWWEIVDRLRDLDEPVTAGLTPLEVAAHVDRNLVPLARAVTKQRFASVGVLDETDVQSATLSFRSTDAMLTARLTRIQKWKARFRLTSLRRPV